MFLFSIHENAITAIYKIEHEKSTNVNQQWKIRRSEEELTYFINLGFVK